MQFVAFGKRHWYGVARSRILKKSMKATIILLFYLGLQAATPLFSQEISLSLKKADLEDVFKAIQGQTHYRFVYTSDQMRVSQKVTIEVHKTTLDKVMEICLQNQPLTYKLEEKLVVIRFKDKNAVNNLVSVPFPDVNGKVTGEDGIPIAGATIAVKGTNKATATSDNGEFLLKEVEPGSVLIISSIGYQSQEFSLQGRTSVIIQLRLSVGSLDETVVIAYGTTTKRLNTGSVSKVSASEITKQPVSNPMAALQGRVPGLLVTQSSGLPGSAFFLQIRGKNSLSQGTQPMYIIDGVPFMLNSNSLSQSALNASSQSPLNSINPSDIESIEILKDADAIAIYGSQGANGVVLITTKKGHAGKTNLDVSFYTGFGKVTRTVDLLGTPEYLAMRREAYRNDAVNPTVSLAPDLLLWDTTRYTDWKKLLIGGTARITNAQATLSGGNAVTQYLLGAGYYSEVTVFPGDQPATRGSVRLNLSHTSPGGRLRITTNAAYSVDEKKLSYNDLTRFIYLPPDAPPIYDSTGNLNWVNGFDNPMSYLHRKYDGETLSLIANATIQYRVFPFLQLRANLGYNDMELSEQVAHPIKAQRPSASTTGSAEISESHLKSWIIEPQVQFTKPIGNNTLDILAGLSFQQRKQSSHKITGTQFTSDDLLGNMASAGQITATNSLSQYNYAALFGRINYSIQKKYIVNLNLRRDGSSRFGPSKRFASFGAIGGAWIFSEEKIFRTKTKFLSFGKLRGSVGVTGNDQIGDYQYLDAWNATNGSQYQGAAGILPAQLYNSTFRWERNKKTEAALELGLFKNRVQLTAAWYRNKADNQLVFYRLPAQTGFSTILKNLDAGILNSGFEIELSVKSEENKKIFWQSSINITIPKSKLLRYPGLDISSDKYNYIIGEPLDIFFGFDYLGVNDSNGVYQFLDINRDGKISTPSDIKHVGRIGQRFYGGILNTIRIGNFQADIFFDFRSQTGKNYLATLSTRPGAIGNQPVYVMDRWQKPGDRATVQRFTTTSSHPAFAAYNNYRSSSALITEASFIRLKNVSLAYELPFKLTQRMKLKGLRIYLRGQNLLTITGYKGADPETQNLITLPPLKVFTGGLQINL